MEQEKKMLCPQEMLVSTLDDLLVLIRDLLFLDVLKP